MCAYIYIYMYGVYTIERLPPLVHFVASLGAWTFVVSIGHTPPPNSTISLPPQYITPMTIRTRQGVPAFHPAAPSYHSTSFCSTLFSPHIATSMTTFYFLYSYGTSANARAIQTFLRSTRSARKSYPPLFYRVASKTRFVYVYSPTLSI